MTVVARVAPPGRYGVIGHPVAHSLSPEIHAAFAAEAGIRIDYARVLAPLDGFAATVDAFVAGGGRGLNVTVPFKLEAHDACRGRLSPRAAAAGAVNWLGVDDRGLYGDNTDGTGLVADLQRLLAMRGGLAGARLLVIGAGGAARGVLGPLLAAAPATVTIANRAAHKAEALVRAHAVEDAPPIRACPLDRLDGGFDVVVNATSASLGDEDLALAPSVLADARLVYDMMYAAAPTRFLRTAERAGAVVVSDGLGMLVEQAAESFFLWHGFRPRTAPVLDALRARLASIA